jgi:acyclic terpene utilization AtuA family protein
MLVASRELGVPMIIGSSGDTGSNSRVDMYVRIIRELAAKHRLAPFKLGYFYSEVDRDLVRSRMRRGEKVAGLEGHADLTDSELDATSRIVAMAGVHPFIRLLEQGADVIIGGRSSDSCVFAAPAIHHGFPESQAYYLGKVLECASFCAEPYGGKETVLGKVTRDAVEVTAMAPVQRCTVASVAGHAMYERANPYYEHVAGGTLDMAECAYEQIAEKTTRITGARFRRAEEFRVKLEGAGKVGERYVGMVGIRDPYTIAHVDAVIAWARDKVRERFGESGYELHYTVYGRDGVMGALEPNRDRPAHELCILVQGVAPTAEMAEELAMIGTRQMFYARLPEVKGSAGSVAFALDEVLRASPAYRWTLNHTLRCDDPLELFPTHVVTIGA